MNPNYHDISVRNSSLLVEKIDRVIEQNFQSRGFDLRQMATALSMSERQLQRQLKSLTGRTPSEYVRTYRLSKSLEYLLAGRTVRETARAVGFSSQAYFASCFKAEYGRTPTQYQQRHM